MKALHGIAPSPALRGAWCGQSIARTALLEAVSHVTPALESFFIRTVRERAAALGSPEARTAAADFAREEARHSAAHHRLNRALAGPGDTPRPPPALRAVRAALEAADARLALGARLHLVDLMERASARLSATWLRREAAMRIDCPYARALFAAHAREELGHAPVVRALRDPVDHPGPVAAALLSVGAVVVAAAYLAAAVPWLAARKRRLMSRVSGAATPVSARSGDTSDHPPSRPE